MGLFASYCCCYNLCLGAEEFCVILYETISTSVEQRKYSNLQKYSLANLPSILYTSAYMFSVITLKYTCNRYFMVKMYEGKFYF